MTTPEAQINKLENDICSLLEEFTKSTGKEVKDICVRYAFALPSGNRTCLLSPDITIYDENEMGIQ